LLNRISWIMCMKTQYEFRESIEQALFMQYWNNIDLFFSISTRPTMILYGINNIRDLFGHKVLLYAVSLLAMRSYYLNNGFSSFICLLFFAGGSWSHQDKSYMWSRGLIKWCFYVFLLQNGRHLVKSWGKTCSSAQNLPRPFISLS
jgi:hypothetical protein